MMFRRLLGALAALMLGSAATQAAPALWKVSDENSSVWIFGSVHLLPPDTDWRTETFDKILSKAERVYFETDISVEAQMAIADLSYELGFSDGELLSERIGRKLTNRLRAAAEDYGVPMPLLLTMEPWMAASTLSIGVLQASGYDPMLGVDPILTAEIPAERKGFLETPEQQLDFLAGGDEDEQIAMLEATLDGLDVMEAEIGAMVDAWLSGDPEALGDVFMTQMGPFGDNMVETLIDQRNADWAEQITGMLERDEAALLVVGAAHMVDEVSVVRMLERRGFVSERVQ